VAVNQQSPGTDLSNRNKSKFTQVIVQCTKHS